MKNYIQKGDNLTVQAPADLTAGAGVLVGAIFGVAQGAAVNGAEVVIVRSGVFELPKTSAQAWTQGAKLYWNDTTKVVTTAASGNTAIGAAAAAAANPSTTGLVLLDGVVR